MRRRGRRPIEAPPRRRRIEAETAPPPPRTAVSGHTPRLNRPGRAAKRARAPRAPSAQSLGGYMRHSTRLAGCLLAVVLASPGLVGMGGFGGGRGEGQPLRSSTTFYGRTPAGAYQIRARDLKSVEFAHKIADPRPCLGSGTDSESAAR